jgi:hypothetical protein
MGGGKTAKADAPALACRWLTPAQEGEIMPIGGSL